jgi:hypothetical protein
MTVSRVWGVPCIEVLVATLSLPALVAATLRHCNANPTTPPVISQASPQPPTDVYLGAYLIRIPSLSFHDNQWTVDAYVWFRWRGTLDPSPPGRF